MVAEYFAALNAALESVKRLRDISKKVKNAEIMAIIAELTDQLSDAKFELASLKEKNLALQEEIQQLKLARSDEKEKPTTKWGVYQFNGEGAFCTACFDVRGKKIRLTRTSPKTLKCPECKAPYYLH